MKVRFLDLEVSPQESTTYGKFHEASILSVIRAPYLFCFSWKDVTKKKTHVVALPDFPLYKKDPRNDREVVKKLHEVLSQSDVVVCHNVNFDIKLARARFIYHKLPPVKPFKTVCTLQLARRIGLFPSNSLKEIAIFLGVKRKMETSKTLWSKIHFDQDPRAWKEMRRYNRVDTEVGCEIFHILRGWTGKPDKLKYDAMCQECGSNETIWRGLRNSGLPGYRFSCQSCGVWGTVKI